MTTDIDSPRTTTRQVAEKAMDLSLTTDPKVLKALAQGYVEELRLDDVPVVTLRASAIVDAARAVQAAGETRLITDGWQQGHEWVDPGTGEVYEFRGAPGERECKDPEGFKAALLAAGAPESDAHRCVYPVLKVNMTVANELAKRSAALREVVEDWCTRRPNGPPHLRAKE